MRHGLKRRLIFAITMSLITGSMTVAVGILHNYGITPRFFALWLNTVVVVYPTIMLSVFFIAPRVQRMIDRRLPPSRE